MHSSEFAQYALKAQKIEQTAGLINTEDQSG